MRLSPLGLGLIFIGILIIGVALANPTLTIVNVSQSGTTSVNVPISSEYPSSTSASSPTIFAHQGFADIAYGWQDYAYATSSSVGGTGSVPASLQITSTSGYTDTEVVAITVSIQITSAGGQYHAEIQGKAIYNFSNPSSSSAVYAFTIVPSSTAVTIGSYTVTLQSSPTTYGQFPSSALQNVGHFYVGISLTSLEKITSTSQVLWFNVSGFPTQLYVAYVEDNGSTLNWGSIYFVYSETTSSGTVVVSNQQVILATASNGGQAPSQIMIGGQTYSGYYAQISINSPSQITLGGYISNISNGQNYQLMELAGNFTSSTVSPPHFTENQYVSFIIGGILILLGAIVIFRK